MPIALRAVPAMVGLSIDAARIDQLTLMITVRSDHRIPDRRAARIGAALANRKAEKLRVWPFPYFENGAR